MSGRGALAGVIVLGAVAAYLLFGVDWSGLATFGMSGSPPSTASQVAWLAGIAGAVALAGMVAFGGEGTGLLRAAGASLGGHAVAVIFGLVAGAAIASILDSVLAVATPAGTIGVAVSVVLAGGHSSRRMWLLVLLFVVAGLVSPLGGAAVSLAALPLLYVGSWAFLPPAARIGHR